MALKGKGRFSIIRIACAFKYAIQGIFYATKVEKNFQIHITCGVVVGVLSFLLKINKTEWLFIIISIFGVLALELVNSALERTVDIATKEIKPLAKQAKDLAAAAVLVYAIMSVIIGILILGPKLIMLF
ncbi:diacylglycerol kinase family protein [Lederbergia panacisoli]|uniref:diacylglycerol kinase family protein n=1 Tax=Lederbergia panacisoli TaxID=1255251 RepID=UPI00214B6882|nr:diacylglycerol kinase family protein [Lederbergia panacisoli]MCR2820432.1 diacylglycerol kinase family protein [Lederbergia panacisoli]